MPPKMKSLAFSIAFAALVAPYQGNASVLVEFGSLYGYDPSFFPTSVIDAGGDPLGTSLQGVSLWFLCLDEGATSPGNVSEYQWEYTLSENSSVLSGGVWDAINVTADRESIVTGISNMFLNNQSAIYADTTSDGSSNMTPGSSMQLAAWSIIHGYGSSWTGVLDVDAIDAIIADNPEISGTLTEDYLYSSLVTNSNANGRVFFGTPTGDTPLSFQNVLLFTPYPVPEPSGFILLGSSGMLALLARRRRA